MTLPKNVDDIFRLSPMQHLMLLHSITEEGHGVLLNQVHYDVRGALDVDAFRAAWQDVVARHAALRTAFVWEGIPHPVQVVRSTATVQFTYHDLSAMSADQQARTLSDHRRDDARAPMVLGKAPLMRCALFALGDERYRFDWTIHHLVVDRWSHAVIFDDLRSAYAARLGQEAPAPPPAPRFREYIDWIERQDREGAERFWRAELAGFHEPTPLASHGQPGRARVTTRGVLDAEHALQLRRCASRCRATTGAVLQSAIALLVAERSRSHDVAFGLTVSGRPPELHDVAGTVGSFVNNIPVRVQLTDETPVDALVRELHRAEGRRLPYAHESPVRLLEWTALPPGCPLFDTLVVLNHATDVDVAWPDVSFTSEAGSIDASYPFVLAIGAEGDALTLALVHDERVVDANDILQRLGELVLLVTGAEDSTTLGDLVPALRSISRPANPAVAAPHAPQSGAPIIPHDASLSDALLGAWRDVLGVPVGLDDDFFAVGGTSLQAAQLLVRIERLSGTSLPLSTLFSTGSVRALLRVLDSPVVRSGSLVRLRSSGTRPTLYAIPGIDGNPLSLGPLTRYLGPSQPFAAFESPGLDGREPPLTTIEAIAERYVQELLSDEPGEIHLVGICWGAAVAFEMAARLHALGRAPARLALMDPAVLLREAATPAIGGDARFIRERLELYWDEFRAGSWRERSRLVADKARRAARVLAGGESSERNEIERLQVRVRDANTRAVSVYAPRQSYPGATRLFFTAGRDFGVDADPRREWLTLITPEPEIVLIEGTNSGDALSPSHAGSFAGALQTWLGATLGAGA